MPSLPRLALVLALAALPARAQLLEEAPPSPVTAAQELSRAVTILDQALLHQLDGEQWGQVEDEVALGLARVAAARDAGLSPQTCLPVRRTLEAVGARQALLWREVMAEESSWNQGLDEEQRLAWVDGEYAAAAQGLADLADDLTYFQGSLPQTSWLLSELLFNLGRDGEAADALALGLSLWPADADLHGQVRAWAHVLPNPEDLANLLDERVAALDVADADFAGLALETLSMLQSQIGRTAYNEQRFAVSGLAFDRAARSLARAATMPRQWSDDEIAYRRADNQVSAAYSFLGLALDRWLQDRGSEEGAQAAEAAEELLTGALEAVPGHPAASEAVLWLGDYLMTKGDPTGMTAADQGQARDFYGRMAARFEVADWWNNCAFWARETGTAAEAAGDAEEAERLYEMSYQAYEKTIALAPDNARFVNDTGLMLFYHLGRDAERAEELFQRAWALGREVCENPFVEEAVFEENFLAYTDAMLNLARLYLTRGELVAADDMCAQLLELAPERADARLTQRAIDAARG